MQGEHLGSRRTGEVAGLPRQALLALALALAGGCSPHTEKLDEAWMHQGPGYRVKLVRYHENLPFHYKGEIFRVACASAGTASYPAHKTQDAGWVTLTGGGAIGAGDAATLARREARAFRFIDAQTLAWTGNGVSVSFNACASVRHWVPWTLPAELIVPAQKPAYCSEARAPDCRHYDFIGERAARFEDLAVAAPGMVSFVVRTPALRGGKALRVHSSDAGLTWRAEPL